MNIARDNVLDTNFLDTSNNIKIVYILLNYRRVKMCSILVRRVKFCTTLDRSNYSHKYLVEQSKRKISKGRLWM